MALVGNLAIALTARTDRFNRGMRSASGRVRRFTGTVSLAQSVLIPFAKMMAVVAGPLVVGRMIQQTARSTDEITKQARALQVSTEFLVGARHAANLAGVSSSQLASGLHRLNRTLGQAARQGGEAEAAFSDLGLDVARLEAEGTDEAFLSVVDAIGQLPSAQAKADAANRIFGRSYRELIQLVGDGGDSIRAGIREAELLGDSFGGKTGPQVERMNDAFTRLWTTMRGGFRSFVGWIAPVVTRVVEGLVRIRVGARIVWRHLRDTFGPAIIKRVSEWGAAIGGRIMNSARAWFEAFRAFDSGGGVRRVLAHIQNGFSAIGLIVEQVAREARQMAADVLGFAAQAQRVFLELRGGHRAGQIGEQLPGAQRVLDMNIRRHQEWLERAREFGADVSEEESPFFKDLEWAKKHHKQLLDEYNRLQRDLADVQAGETSLERMARGLQEGVKDAGEITDKWLARVSDPAEAAKQGGIIGDMMGSGLVQNLLKELQEAQDELTELFETPIKKAGDAVDDLGEELKQVTQAATPGAIRRGTAAAFGVGAQQQAQARLISLMQAQARQRAEAEKRAEVQRKAQVDYQRRTAEALESGVAEGATL